MTQAPTFRRAYPWNTSIAEVDVTFRLMKPADGPDILNFARELPEEDLMFLRTDITQKPAVDTWMNYIKTGRTISLLAEISGKIAGYASIHLNEATWTRHVAEMRVLIGRDYRGIGLGKKLTNEAFAMARDLGLKKITAQMATDQRGARGVFEHLGFRPEALLADHVMTRDGTTRDLLVMSYDVDGFSNDIGR